MSMHTHATTRAIVFDLDGTLINSAPDIAAAVNRVMNDLDQPELAVDYVENFIGNGSRSMLERIFSDRKIILNHNALDGRLADYLGYYAATPVDRTRCFPDVRDDLKTLQSAGLKLGICTNKPHALTAPVLEKLGIADHFTCVFGADAEPIVHRKPHPQHLHAVINAMGEAPSTVLYVGDSEVDRSCAHAAGVPFFLVGWGGGRFLETGKDTRIGSLADLLTHAGMAGNGADARADMR